MRWFPRYCARASRPCASTCTDTARPTGRLARTRSNDSAAGRRDHRIDQLSPPGTPARAFLRRRAGRGRCRGTPGTGSEMIFVAPMLDFSSSSGWARIFRFPGIGEFAMHFFGVPALIRRRRRRYAESASRISRRGSSNKLRIPVSDGGCCRCSGPPRSATRARATPRCARSNVTCSSSRATMTASFPQSTRARALAAAAAFALSGPGRTQPAVDTSGRRGGRIGQMDSRLRNSA